MRGICAGVYLNFGRKSEKAESFGFMSGLQGDIPGFAPAQRYSPKF